MIAPQKIMAALALWALPLIVANVNGKWRVSFKGAEGDENESIFEFSSDGDKLSGTEMETDAGTHQIVSTREIEDGHLDGSILRFSLHIKSGVFEHYEGHLEADRIEFTIWVENNYESKAHASHLVAYRVVTPKTVGVSSLPHAQSGTPEGSSSLHGIPDPPDIRMPDYDDPLQRMHSAKAGLSSQTRNSAGPLIKGDVSPPILGFKVEPAYSKEARRKNISGIVVLSFVVDADGLPRDIRVIKPLGFGLDEKAVEAVSKWRFHPGMKDGHAVATEVKAEVNFQLRAPPQ